MLLLLILDIFLFSTATFQNKRRASANYIVTYKMEGSGNKAIIGEGNNLPDEVKVNGNKLDRVNHYYDFEESTNIVELIYEYFNFC